ncbi:MAG: S8 family serine peptidase [Syntrophomonas sp.]
MLFIHKGQRRCVLPILLILTILISSWAPLFSPGSALANDRVADIIGSNPLIVPDIVTPSGLTGRGQIIGIADSGLDKGSMTDIHPDLQSEQGVMPKVVMLKSYTDRDVADDPTGHGTHMAATIAGSGKASNGQYHGIAPGASLYFQGLLNKANQLQLPDKLENLFRPAYLAGVKVHVDGWGSGSNTYGLNSAQIDDFVYRYSNFLPVFAAGNNGSGSGTLTSEANSKNVLTVGSSQVPRPAFGPDARYSDQIADSSSRGPAGDGRIKPELLAPGSAVISACSSLVSSNFSANTSYIRMGGSSMAAAVTGGALALLREELKTYKNMGNPSAALMKALLVNGAHSPSGNVSEEGFGILDLAGTILALQENTFQIKDENIGLKAGEIKEYRFKVSDSSIPAKITLAWTDPPAKTTASQALVNNLDLSVQTPGGKTYYGNDFNGQGKADNINNIELVNIPNAGSGEYIIRVRAASINGTNPAQSFALVYGQPLRHEIVKSIDTNNELTLADGDKINLAGMQVHQEVNGKVVADINQVQSGSDLYMGSGTAYMFGSTWETGGIQALPTDEGDLVLEMNNQVREGGHYLDKRAGADGTQNISVNNLPVTDITAIPPGAELKASVNPVLQTLWKLQANGEEITGFVSQVDAAKKEIKLFNNPETYHLAAWAAVSYRDKLVDCTSVDTPFGSALLNDLDKLMPGTKVSLLISPSTRVIQYLKVERPMVIGKVENINLDQRTIRLDTGNEYKLLSGSNLYRDQVAVTQEQLQIGDQLMAQLIPDSDTIIQAQAYSAVVYGRVTYFSTRQNTLYLLDSNNRAHTIKINNDSQIFGWGIPIDPIAISSGSWVRVITDPDGQNAWHIDIAEIDEQVVKTINKYDPVQKILNINDSQYTCTNSTRISKGGYAISTQDLIPGEKAEITTLLAPSPWPSVLVNVEVDVITKVQAPTLQVKANSLNGALVVQGSTSANVIYFYRQDGSRERVQVEHGKFNRLFNLLDNEKELQVVALDTRTGAMEAKTASITVYPVEPMISSFQDTAGHWAEAYINDLGQKGIVSGCGDHTFHPDQTITRSELISMIMRAQNWTWTGQKPPHYFADNGDIPWWALKAVLTAGEHGLIKGYPDGSFRPLALITRSELAVIIYVLIKTDKVVSTKYSLPYTDTATIPLWAGTAFSCLYKENLLEMWGGDNLQPWRPVTRAEAAALIDQINNK